jgi:hypothetical protein
VGGQVPRSVRAATRDRKECRSELFKEVGAYRHAIIHNQAIGTSKTAKLKLLPPVPKDTPVKVDRHTFESIIGAVKKELNVLSIPTRAT